MKAIQSVITQVIDAMERQLNAADAPGAELPREFPWVALDADLNPTVLEGGIFLLPQIGNLRASPVAALMATSEEYCNRSDTLYISRCLREEALCAHILAFSIGADIRNFQCGVLTDSQWTDLCQLLERIHDASFRIAHTNSVNVEFLERWLSCRERNVGLAPSIYLDDSQLLAGWSADRYQRDYLHDQLVWLSTTYDADIGIVTRRWTH